MKRRRSWAKLRENPRRYDFTPSYDASSKEEYRKKVAEGDKRDLHIVVEGGRRRARYGESIEHQTDATREARQNRWDEQDPPWSARTQAPASFQKRKLPPWARKGEGSPEAVLGEDPILIVARAIQTYRDRSPDGALGLVVPDTAWPLIAAGMPKKEASILVGRAARKFYPEVPQEIISGLLAPDLARDVTRALGRALQIQGEGRLVLPMPRRRREAQVQRFFVRVGQRVLPLLSAEDIKQAYTRFRETTERRENRKYRRAEDDQQFLTGIYDALGSLLRATAQREGTTDLTVGILLSFEGREFVRSFSGREHLKSAEKETYTARPKYKNLQNVNLTELPALLVRLASRKRRKGRRLDPLAAKTNPMTSSTSNLEAFVLSEQEAGRLVPVPGKTNKVYWASAKRGLVETTRPRAEAWLAVAAAGRAARSVLSAEASQANKKEGLARGRALPEIEPQPITSRENPMSYEDKYWFRQYQQGPFGASRALPVARRNASTRRKAAKRTKRAANPQAVLAMHYAQQIMEDMGCTWSEALRAGWRQAKEELPSQRAAANPWYEGTPSLYLPDTTTVPGSLVPHAPWDDPTMIYSAVVPGPYGRSNPSEIDWAKAERDAAQLDRAMPEHERYEGGHYDNLTTAVFCQLAGWPCTLANHYKLDDLITDRDPAPGTLGAQLRAKYSKAADLAHRHISRAQAARMNGDAQFMPFVGAPGVTRKGGAGGGMFPHSRPVTPGGKSHGAERAVFSRKGPHAYRRGAFSTSQTGGFQPVNRRNPSVRGQALAAQAMRLYHSGQAPTLKQAWAMVKSAQMNPGKKKR